MKNYENLIIKLLQIKQDMQRLKKTKLSYNFLSKTDK